METNLEATQPLWRRMFKSYYVVWKLLEGPHTLQRVFLFKSYYVVWKQQPVFFDVIWVFWFKSYYVVWKPLFFALSWALLLGLNRTM